jgi:hypothetical protein
MGTLSICAQEALRGIRKGYLQGSPDKGLGSQFQRLPKGL